jgi:acetyl esterase
MAVDEATAHFLAEMAKHSVKPLHQMQPVEARAGGAMMIAMFGSGPEMLRVEEEHLEAGDGSTFRVRTLVPGLSPEGVLVYYHGGGWVVGSIDEYDALGRELAMSTGCAVVMVDYRKAPEHPYPAAVDDAWQALLWAQTNLVAIAGRPVPLMVGGDSAGGNLAAVTSRIARDRSGPAIDLQVLVYPVTDADLDTPSYVDQANQLALSRDSMIWFWDHYAPDAVRTDENISPLQAKDLSGLPPAIVVLAEHDVLRSEGEAYAEALQAAGVPVRRRIFPGQMHGFLHMVNVLPASAAGVSYLAAEIGAFLSDHAGGVTRVR